jgi:hypothetical protein
MTTIVDKLKVVLAGQCLPAPLQTQGSVAPCLVLEALPDPNATCDASRGMSPADPELARGLRARLTAEGSPLATNPICRVAQLAPADLVNGSCAKSSAAGWCYLEGAAAAPCAQSLLFSAAASPQTGARVELACLEEAQ